MVPQNYLLFICGTIRSKSTKYVNNFKNKKLFQAHIVHISWIKKNVQQNRLKFKLQYKLKDI